MENPPEDWTPEKLICLLIGTLCIGVMTASALWFGQRSLIGLWWLPGVMTLAILYATYAARYEMTYWYPYDLPHFALFGLACLFVLEGAIAPALLLFLIDTPLRETSIYLVPVALAVGFIQGRLRRSVFAAAFMLAVWLPFRLWIGHRFNHNPTDTGIHFHRIGIALANPLHWPQMASAFGFLAIPLYLGRKYLSREHWYFSLAALPCIAVTLAFGIWQETRIFDEWTVPFAVIAASALRSRFAVNAADLQSDDAERPAA